MSLPIPTLPAPCSIEPLNPTLHRGGRIRLDQGMTLSRVVSGALPVLCSFPVLAPAASAVSSVLKSRDLVADVVQSVRSGASWRVTALKIGQLAAFVGVVGVSAWNKALGIALSQFLNLVKALKSLVEALIRLDGPGVAAALYSLGSTLIQLWALFAAGSLAAVVCSGLIQVVSDALQAGGLASAGCWYEAVMLLVAAALRAQSLVVPTRRLTRDLTSRAATAEDLQAITAAAKRPVLEGQMKQPPLNLDQELRRRGLSWRVRQLDLSHAELSGLDIKDVTFESCKLEGAAFTGASVADAVFRECDLRGANFQGATIRDSLFDTSRLSQADFSGSCMQRTAFRACWCGLANFQRAALCDVSLNHCELSWSNWCNSSLKRVSVVNSWLDDASFADAELRQTTFKGCDLSYAIMNDALLDQLTIDDSVMEATSFLNARVRSSTIQNSLGIDVLFCGTELDWRVEASRIERTCRPVIAMSWAPQHPMQFGAYAYRSLRERGAVVLRFDMHAPQVSATQLEQEVRQSLARIEREGLQAGSLSRADQLVRDPQGLATSALVQRAEQIASFSDAVLLPGGWDVEPELYGHKRHADTACTEVWNRSILEMALLRQAVDHNLPVMGICRGMQMINVFHGGTLNQDARPFMGSFHVITPNSLLPQEALAHLQAQGIDLAEFHGYSCHHQAIDQLGQGLETACRGENLIKGIISRNGQFFGTQFHPELCSQVDYEALDKIRDKLQKGEIAEEKAMEIWKAYQTRYGELDGTSDEAKELLLRRIAMLQEAAQVWGGILQGFVSRASRQRVGEREVVGL